MDQMNVASVCLILNFLILLSSAAVTVTTSQSIPPKFITSIAKMAAVHMPRSSSPYASSSSDNDSINAPTGSALRRLYFQSGKSSQVVTNGPKSTIPKVVVKNSSCNSTINTSTDSASTHLTNVTTATDTTETFDSLDFGEFDKSEVKIISFFLY